MTEPLLVAVDEDVTYFGVRFRPGMATAFLRDAADLKDQVRPLASLMSARSRMLLEQLSEASTTERLVNVMERWLVPADIRGLEEGRSERTTRRLYLDLVGVPPKLLSRILRFRSAIGRMASGQPNWAHFAAACGYYDQAHMIREFSGVRRMYAWPIFTILCRIAIVISEDEPAAERKLRRLCRVPRYRY